MIIHNFNEKIYLISSKFCEYLASNKDNNTRLELDSKSISNNF